MTEQETAKTFWSVVSDMLTWVVDTEVSLAVVLVLLLIGAIREAFAYYFKPKGPPNV